MSVSVQIFRSKKQNRAKYRRVAPLFAIFCLILLVGGVYFAPAYQKAESTFGHSLEAITCRASVLLEKVGDFGLGLSWTELATFATLQYGFHCMRGRSLEASLVYSAEARENDLVLGKEIFHERCSGCHGGNGSGGPHAPSLARLNYKRGDSDLSLYKILRDGISGTAMPSFADLSVLERLQATAFLNKMLRWQAPHDSEVEAERRPIHVTAESLLAAGTNPEEWLTYSGSYSGWRHSTLTEITPANVSQLRNLWVKQFVTNDPKLEATPLVIGGVIFTVAPYSDVVALDARTGKQIWEYKRSLPADLPLCCGPVNRGLAVYNDTLFYGSPDGYLVAINANNGTVIWETLVAKSSEMYSMTGAPLVVSRSVVVGVAGSEYGVRGFLAAYDVSTGERQWKFETIPGPGELGHQTWENDAWRNGGGNTWITGSYDPSTDLLYWGVANPSPVFAGDARPGDNLFTNSVIALHASTGKMAWYFQFTPHDEHDWDSAQTPILADLMINGEERKVICWLNRNGFYYILDRVTGEFLHGVPFVKVNWATGLTSAGRPILSAQGKVTMVGQLTEPGIDGGTNWQNPAFDQKRGLVFVPAALGTSLYTNVPPDKVVREPNGFYSGSSWSIASKQVTRAVRALDAATGQQRWEYISSPSGGQYSGLLSTEGGLVFGAAAGDIFALDAETGREVWRLPLGGNTVSPPISFAIDGRQVIAITAGQALFVFGL